MDAKCIHCCLDIREQMKLHKLILLLSAFLWLVPTAVANVTVDGRRAELIDGSNIEKPQRTDLGMCDILMVNSATSLAAPTNIRVHYDASPAFVSPAMVRHLSQACTSNYAAVDRPYVHRGYIYLLCCLRL